MIDVRTITHLHAETVRQWHEEEIDNRYRGFLNLVCRQHQQNFRLWHEEDVARSQGIEGVELAAVARRIDKLKERRNELIEQLDGELIDQLRESNVKHSLSASEMAETPGRMIDRLSILAVWIYHTREEADSQAAEERDRQEAEAKLDALYQQLDDLSASLSNLMADLFAGRTRLGVGGQVETRGGDATNWTPGKIRKTAA